MAWRNTEFEYQLKEKAALPKAAFFTPNSYFLKRYCKLGQTIRFCNTPEFVVFSHLKKLCV